MAEPTMHASTPLAQRLRALKPDQLRGIRRGLEKESLRAQPGATLALTPGARCRSSRLALRTARPVPKCISNAFLRAGPMPGTSSRGDAPIARARFSRCAPIAKR